MRKRWLISRQTLACIFILLASSFTQGEIQISKVRTLVDWKAVGLGSPEGLTYNTKTQTLFLATKSPGTVHEISFGGRVLRSYPVWESIPDADRLEGIAYDHVTGNLLLAKGDREILSLDPAGVVSLFFRTSSNVDADGIAVHPVTGNIFLADDDGQRICEVDRTGQILNRIELTELGLLEPQGVAFWGTYLLVADDRDSTSSLTLLTPEGVRVQTIDAVSQLGLIDPDGVVTIDQKEVCVADDDGKRIVCFSDLLPSVPVPFSAGLEDTFVGFAALNRGLTPNPINVSGYNREGHLVTFEQMEAVDPGGQMAKLTTEVFVSPSTVNGLLHEAVEPLTLSLKGQLGPIQGFFMIGDESRTRLDGIGATGQFGRELYLTGTTKGQAEQTFLWVNNDNRETTQVTVNLNSLEGQRIGSWTGTLRPNGSLMGLTETIFPDGDPLQEGYLSITASRPVQAFQLTMSAATAEMLSGQIPSTRRNWYCPYFFAGSNGENTAVRLLNVKNSKAVVTLTAFDRDGVLLRETELEVPPGALHVVKMNELLSDLLPGSGDLLVGFVRLRSWNIVSGIFETNSLMVSTVTYTGTDGETQTVLPFQPQTAVDLVIPHIAQSPASGISQGLALFNAGSTLVEVELEAFDPRGQLITSRIIELAPKQQVLGLLNEAPFFGPSFEQIGGSLEVHSTENVLVESIMVGAESFTLLEGQPAVPRTE
ncbi:MAG: hypothetical protein JSU96_05585 [Acidobacteriota bacterium]|nr:MAG: hypothetical protein JSU96_05585 [Acidobacteriota bacterium]